jgi:hypothetical protein
MITSRGRVSKSRGFWASTTSASKGRHFGAVPPPSLSLHAVALSWKQGEEWLLAASVEKHRETFSEKERARFRMMERITDS